MLQVRYFAGARAAAGVSEEWLATPPATLADLVAVLGGHRGEALARVLTVSSFLVDGETWRDRERPLPATGVVDVLPPFAGG